MDHMPIRLITSTCKVEMSFTTHDHCHSSLDFYFAGDAQDMRNALEILQSHRQECADRACKLTTTWWQKFYDVAFLRLDFCILDFAAEFFIYAPTQDLAVEIWDILVFNNP